MGFLWCLGGVEWFSKAFCLAGLPHSWYFTREQALVGLFLSWPFGLSGLMAFSDSNLENPGNLSQCCSLGSETLAHVPSVLLSECS